MVAHVSHLRVYWAALKVGDGDPAGLQIERALNESERQFRLLVESVVNYAMLMLDVDGRIVTRNNGATRIKGCNAEIIGQDHSTFYTKEDRAKGRSVRPSERQQRVCDEIGLSPIETDEGAVVLSAIVDISDRKEDRIHVALKEKDVLLGRIAPSRQEQPADHPRLTDLQSSRLPITSRWTCYGTARTESAPWG